MVRVWPFRRKRRHRIEVPPLTLGLWLDVLRAVGVASPKGIPLPRWNGETADVEECYAMVQAVAPDMEAEMTTEALRAAAIALWDVLSARAYTHVQRAGDTIDAVEQALGHFIDGGNSVTLSRVLYQLPPTDLETVLGWPLWRAIEWIAIRSIEADFQEENARLARMN